MQKKFSYSPFPVSNYENQFLMSDHCGQIDINQIHKVVGNTRNGELSKRCRSQST